MYLVLKKNVPDLAFENIYVPGLTFGNRYMYLAWLSKIRYTWPGFRSVASVGAEVPEPQQPTMLRNIVLINSFQ